VTEHKKNNANVGDEMTGRRSRARTYRRLFFAGATSIVLAGTYEGLAVLTGAGVTSASTQSAVCSTALQPLPAGFPTAKVKSWDASDSARAAACAADLSGRPVAAAPSAGFAPTPGPSGPQIFDGQAPIPNLAASFNVSNGWMDGLGTYVLAGSSVPVGGVANGAQATWVPAVMVYTQTPCSGECTQGVAAPVILGTFDIPGASTGAVAEIDSFSGDTLTLSLVGDQAATYTFSVPTRTFS
jgi:hypothetical protein